MPTEATSASTEDGESEVMASIDDDGSRSRVVIADITTDDAWLAMALPDAASLPDCR